MVIFLYIADDVLMMICDDWNFYENLLAGTKIKNRYTGCPRITLQLWSAGKSLQIKISNSWGRYYEVAKPPVKDWRTVWLV